MLGVFAEFERSLIEARVNTGLARARAKGTRLGRPRTPAKVEQRIRELAAQGIGKLANEGQLKIQRETGSKLAGARRRATSVTPLQRRRAVNGPRP